jgi:hypothetical protein
VADHPPQTRFCPSATAAPGNLLLGVVGEDGTVAILPEPLTIDKAFLDVAHRGRSPEERFRFAGACHKGACKQWATGRCTVIDRAIATTRPPEPSIDLLPECAIRGNCRWYTQSGATACHACPLVVTDVGSGVPA